MTESKTRCFDNLNVKDVTEDNSFRKTIKPFHIYEIKNSNNILHENYQTIWEYEKICKIFYNYFTNVTKGLKSLSANLPMSPKASSQCQQIVTMKNLQIF